MMLDPCPTGGAVPHVREVTMRNNNRQSRGNGTPAIHSGRLLAGVSLAAVVALGVSYAAHAQEDRYWDANGTSPGVGGSGQWDVTNQFWSQSESDVLGPYLAWDNSALDNAIFGITLPGVTTTVGTITLAGPITVHDMVFQAVNGWILDGGTLTLAGATPTITTGGDTTINSIIGGTAGITKLGSRTLYLRGMNTFSGGITLGGGTLRVDNDSGLGAPGNDIDVTSSSSLRIDSGSSSRTVSTAAGQTLSIQGVGTGGMRYSGAGNLSVGTSISLTNDTSDFTGSIRFNGCNGVCTTYFSSIGNLGEASSLGAPTDEATGTILFQQQSQYSDNVIYIGDGDSSNRNWDLNGQAAIIRNRGTGTLSLTGDIDVSGGGSFNAEDADFELLGTLSGANFGFGGNAGRSVTLGGDNIYAGTTSIAAVTVHAPVLADTGANSSFGTGTAGGITISSAGALSYTGDGDGSDRAWTIGSTSTASASGGILNDGTGALDLSGTVTFGGAANNNLTLGGSFTGTNTLSGVIAGNGNVVSTGSGTWLLSGANTYVGATIVDAGTLQAGSAAAFGATTGITVNGGTLDINNFDIETPVLGGSGGTISLGASGSLTVNGSAASSYAGSIVGGGSLSKIGSGTLTLTGANSYTGDTNIGGGSLVLDFSEAGGPSGNIIAGASTLNMSGGTLRVIGADGEANSQTFSGFNVTAGSNRIAAVAGSGGSVDLALGTINRLGGVVDFVTPVSGAITTSSADGVLGGWATINGTDYAKVVGGTIVSFDETDYVSKDDAASWISGDIVTDVEGAADSPFFGVVSTGQQLGGLRYTAAADSLVTITAGQTLGLDGTIIVAPSVGEFDQTITGGSITGAAGGGTFGVQQNSGGVFAIDSSIVDNGGATGFVKGGSGIVQLNGSNSYTGVTTLSGGRLEVASLADGGSASSIGAASADASNLVLEGGTFAYVGGADAVTDRGFTLVNGGAGEPAIQVDAGRIVEFSGLVTSPDDAGFTKTGWGTLILSNTANDYVGVTTITGNGSGNASTLSVSTLADGGTASGIGAATSDASNLVLSDGGRLQYTGGTVAIDRGFTLQNSSGRIEVTQAGTTLTVSGEAVGTAGLVKEGDGTLVLAGANSYTGGNRVAAGTLRAGSTTAFGGAANGTGAGAMTVEAGATLDLAGFSNYVGGLNGDGDVTLGSATLNINSGGTFSGTISGTGGISMSRFTQTMIGCGNDYTGTTVIASGLTTDCIADGGSASGIGASSAASSSLVFTGGSLGYTGGDVVTDRGFTLQSGAGIIDVINAATTLEFTGEVVGAGFLEKRGDGALVLSGANSYANGTRIRAGVLQAGSTSAFGTGNMTIDNVAGATLDLNGFDNDVRALIGGGTLGGNVLLGGATMTFTATGSGAADYAGAISGSGAIVKDGTYTQTLSGCGSDYAGTTTITRGVLAVACLNDGNSASSIGTSSAAAGNLVLDGGTLRYVGAGGSTDRQFTLGAATGSALDASGTGAIAFTSSAPITFGTADTVQALTLTGTNSDDNILAAQITNNGTGTTSLTKTGAGTWILRNAGSTYTGATIISGGVLGVDKLSDGGEASSIGASSSAASNLMIGNGSTLRYTGSGDATDRLFTLAVGTTFIESSGTGAIVFTDTGPVTLQTNNQSRTIALGGTNGDDNTLAGSIGNAGTGVTSLAKNDAGNWVLTGNNTYTGNTVINDGRLQIGAGGTTGSIVGNVINGGLLAFDRSDSYVYAGTISGAGAVEQIGGGATILTGNSSYTGGTTIADGTLQLGNGGTSGAIAGNVANDGVLAFNRSNSFTFGGQISGTGAVHQSGTGTTVLTGANSYAGGTLIDNGTLQVSADDNLGDAAGALTFDGGTLRTTASLDSDRDVTLTGAGTMLTDSATIFTLSGSITGAGSLTKDGAGQLVLTGNGNFDGGTTIAAGRLQLGDGGTSGSITGDVANSGVLAFNRLDDIGFDGLISGTGSVVQDGAGIVTLTGANSYAGSTTVNAGTLRINGDQSAATGVTTVNSGATLGGSGTIGGSVNVADGGMLAPGNSPGTLTINGDLSLAAGSVLDFEFGAANVVGGPLNDLIEVGGDLVLDGTINVDVSAGGDFGGGVYRVFNYDGTLTNNGLALGTMPAGSSVTVQTSIGGQVNLINSTGLELSFWDGNGPKFNDTVDGGDGTWHLAGTDNNWTEASGGINAAYADGTFAIFAGTGGNVAVDNGNGAVTASAMQFASNGYLITGDTLTLTDAQSTIRVGDGTEDGANFGAQIAADLTGAAQLVKTDLGTLVLSGNNSYTGGTLVAGGTLSIASDANLGAASGGLALDGSTLRTTASLASARAISLLNDSTVLIDGGTIFTSDGIVSGAGGLIKAGAGTLVLTAANTYAGGTTIQGGAVRVSDDANLGDVSGTLSLQGGTLQAGASFASTRNLLLGSPSSNTIDTQAFDVTLDGTIGNGPGNAAGNFLNKLGSGTLTLTGVNSYANRTIIAGGTLALAGSGTIGAGNLVIGSGAIFDISQTDTGARVIQLNGAADGIVALGSKTLTLGFGNSFTDWAGTIVDGGIVDETGGSVVISAPNGAVRYFGATSYTGGTTVAAGSFELAGNGSLYAGGAVAVNAGAAFTIAGLTAAGTTIGDLSGGGTVALGDKSLTLGTSNSTDFSGVITGNAGSIVKNGSGTFALFGANDYTGATTVNAGTLLVNGNQAAATGLTSVLNGATIGGSGTIGGDVTVADGGTLAPGNSPGTLTIAGNLSLAAGSILDFEFGEANVAGGALNDLVEVGGDLVLDGTINVDVSAGGDFGGGVYRVFNYGGTLTDNGLALGTMPAGSEVTVQTAVAGQVNLVNTAGLDLSFWDGDGGPKFDGVIDGGDGVWHLGGTDSNWTEPTGIVNAAYAEGTFAIFAGTGGVVTVDNDNGPVTASGMQFASDDYLITGEALTLVGPSVDIRVGDGSTAGGEYVATIAADLTGGAALEKTDLGTLILTGANSYTGGTTVAAGTLQLGDGGAGGSIIGDVVNDGVLAFNHASDTVFTGDVSGTGFLLKQGDNSLVLTGANEHSGGTTIAAGTLQIGDGGTTGSIVGDIANEGTLAFDREDVTTFAGTISGNGSLRQDGTGTLVLSGSNNFAGGTTIAAGTLQLGDGGTDGSIVGNVVNDGTLAFNRSDAIIFDDLISGSGSVVQDGPGIVTLGGANSYAGRTLVNAGGLFLEGDQTAATGLTVVGSGARLGGSGIAGGDMTVADGAAISPGSNGASPGMLTVNGALTLASGSTLAYDFGQADAVGGPLNDLIEVGGDLVLDGTLNIAASAGGTFDPGIYRVLNYGGALTDNGLDIGAIPSGTDFYVQTSISHQVNLVNTSGLVLRFWDGAAGVRNDGLITGGAGLWQNSTGNDNWTLDDASINAPFLDSAFAVFGGVGGEVIVDESLGAVEAAGMQFAVDGYAIAGDDIHLTGTQAVVRVGDGTAAGAGYTATISSTLTGDAGLVKSDLGTLILTGGNDYAGGTWINGGTLRISADDNLGDAAGNISFDGGTLHTTADMTSDRAVALAGTGTLSTDGGTTLGLGGAISGTGDLVKQGAGTLLLTGAASHSGGTIVNAGSLFVDGDQSAATGLTSVNMGAVLGGAGIIGGDVTVAADAILDPGSVDGLPGTLTIAGNLSLASGANLSMQFGDANVVGGALNDLVQVGGDLVLDGTLNVTESADGSFGAGIYRVLNYGGTLTDNGLVLGTMPAGSTATIQTSVAGQVNLVNTAGLALNFWDGDAGPKFDGAINGGDGVWQNGTGNDNWTDAGGAVNASYANGAYAVFTGAGGIVTVDDSLGNVNAAGLQFAADGYEIDGDALALAEPRTSIRVGDGTSSGSAFVASISAELTGTAQLVKTDAGTLILAGANSYTGGTAIEGGTLAISADANLGDAAGGIDLNGGTLRTMADFASGRSLTLVGDGTVMTDDATSFTLDGALSGSGSLTKAGGGTFVIAADNSSYVAVSNVAGGTLAVDGILGGSVNVTNMGRLEGNGRVGGIANAGVVAPGRGGIGTLAIAGDYVGNGGTLEIEAALGDDMSPADLLAVNGATSGTTRIAVLNRDGIGAQTIDGIKIIDVTGASDGAFVLNGDYAFQGEQTVIAGAYGYRLYKNGVADPQDGDWYLRSSLLNPPPGEPGEPVDPDPSTDPLYQPGVPVYEGYTQTLLALGGLPTMQQRIGNRSWAAAPGRAGGDIWGRMETRRHRPQPVFSTSGADKNIDSWQMQIGIDRMLAQRADGAALIAGLTAHYGKADAGIASIFGNGSIDTEGLGFGATLSWYGPKGLYVDGQAKLSWFDSDLRSGTLGTLVKGNDGNGQAFSLELGKRSSVGGGLTLTPQAQMIYTHVDFDRFVDPAGAVISADRGSSLKTRWGISLDHQQSWDSPSGDMRRTHLYGLVNLTYEWLDGTRVDVSSTPVANRDRRLWGELGVGGSYSWGGDRFTLYTEISGDTSISDLGDGYGLKGTAGLRISF